MSMCVFALRVRSQLPHCKCVRRAFFVNCGLTLATSKPKSLIFVKVDRFFVENFDMSVRSRLATSKPKNLIFVKVDRFFVENFDISV